MFGQITSHAYNLLPTEIALKAKDQAYIVDLVK